MISTETSKRNSKRSCDQAITNPDSSVEIRSNAIANSTARGVTRKRNAEDSPFKSRKKGTRTESFEKRGCKQLIDFIDEFEHCRVTSQFSADSSFGNWCGTMRYFYTQIQQGQTQKRKSLKIR